MKLGAFPHRFADASLAAAALEAGGAEAERLEWLGDRVLGCCVADLLMSAHPQRSEAELTRALGRLVNNQSLHALGEQLQLGAPAPPRAGKWALAGAVEALIGAAYRDGGYAAARACAAELFAERLAAPDAALWLRDAKTLLKEACEGRAAAPPRFEVVSAGLQGHQVRCAALGTEGVGSGRTKQAAEQAAAAAVIRASADADLLAQLL